MKLIKTFLAGFFIGVANVIPGVSGGTMAVVFGVYEMMVEVLSLNFKNIKKYILPLFILFLGIVVGILGFAQVMGYLLENHRDLTYTVFLGIIFGSFPLIAKLSHIREKNVVNLLGLVITTILVTLMIVYQDRSLGDIDVTILTPAKIIGLLVASSLSTITMIIPGVSGSMLLVMIGYYSAIFSYIIRGLVFPHLIIVLIGMVIGLILGSKLMSMFLKKHSKFIYHVILGLIVGSSWSIIPSFSQPLFQLIAFVVSAGFIYIINKK
jgi:putative membrane protein